MNSVSIIGMLRENIDKEYRYFAYELPYGVDHDEEPRIVVKYWTNLKDSRLITLPIHTRVAIQGHLDCHEKFATILVVEEIQVLK